MRQWFLFMVIVAIVFACSESDSSSADKASKPAATPKVAEAEAPKGPDGEKVFKTYCVTCHGLYGDMGANGAHNLQESVLAVEERVAVIKKGRNTMTGFEAILDEDQINAVAEYTLSLKK